MLTQTAGQWARSGVEVRRCNLFQDERSAHRVSSATGIAVDSLADQCK